MSLGIFPVFDGEVANIRRDYVGESLAREFVQLDQVAAQAGVTPITAFADDREVPDDFDGSPDELEELLGPSDQWFDASEGSRACQSLAAAISNDNQVAVLLEAPEQLVAELRSLGAILEDAHRLGRRFRLELS